MKDKELEEQIGDVFARACKNNEYFGNDGWYELHTPTARQEIKALIAQERRKAKIEVVKSLISKARERYWREAETDIQAVDLTDLLKLLAELKEDKGGNKGE